MATGVARGEIEVMRAQRHGVGLVKRNGVLDESGHRLRIGILHLQQTRRDGETIGLGAILAHLPLADQLRYGNLDAHDACDHPLDEIDGSIGDGPWQSLTSLVNVREFIEVCQDPRLVVYHTRKPMRVNDRVVPSRNDFAVRVLARVPGRRDVAVRALKGDDRGNGLRAGAPHGVRASDVAREGPELASARIEQERHVIDDQFAWTLSGPRPERMSADERLQYREIIFRVSFRNVHVGLRSIVRLGHGPVP